MIHSARSEGARPDENAPAHPLRGSARWIPAIALALAALAILLATSAAGAGAAPAATPVTASTGVWAWGAFENASYETEVLGAYADTLNLTSGNLSSSTAVVGELAADRALYGAYTIVNATAPNASARALEVRSIAIANYSAIVEVAGTLPAPGFYAPGAAVTLANLTGFYYASEVDVSAYAAYANYTLSNGTLALANEHVELWDAVNETFILYHWPGYVNHPNGSTTVTSTTEGAVALSWVAESFSAAFTPVVPISVAPLSVGENWTANTSATIVGWAADASASAYSSGVTNTSASSSGGWSLNTTASLGFGFAVTGSEEVVFPNGTTGTGYTIVATENGTGASAYTLWDGLAILPAGAVPSTAPAAPAAPAAIRASAPDAAGTTQSEAVVSDGGFPVATSSAVSGTETLRTAPLDPTTAKTAIQGTVTPSAPSTAKAPTVTGPPTLAGTTGTTPSTTPPPAPTTNPPSTPPSNTTKPTPSTPVPSSGHAKASPLTPELLAGIVAGIAAAFIAVELVVRRRAA
jgi:hypothetical protein